MTVSELLIQRYKCIALSPFNCWEIGDILYLFDFEGNKWWAKEPNAVDAIHQDNMHKYPHLFQPLPWYSERRIEDMPEYLKDNTIGKVVIKVHKWIENDFVCFIAEANKKIDYPGRTENWIPATSDEFNAYKSLTT